MNTGEYILAMMAIISGLAITHLIGRASTLIERRSIVQWDWLTIVAALYLAYIIIYGWWFSFAAFRAETADLPFFRFLLPTLNVIFLALAARAVLPDAVAATGVDLAEHYTRNCRFVFLCLLICYLTSVWGVIVRLRTSPGIVAAMPGGAALNGAAIVMIAVLAITSRRAVHAVLVPFLFAALVLTTITKII